MEKNKHRTIGYFRRIQQEGGPTQREKDAVNKILQDQKTNNMSEDNKNRPGCNTADFTGEWNRCPGCNKRMFPCGDSGDATLCECALVIKGPFPDDRGGLVGNFGMTGWICPKCGAGMSPYVNNCSCHIAQGIMFNPTCGT